MYACMKTAKNFIAIINSKSTGEIAIIIRYFCTTRLTKTAKIIAPPFMLAKSLRVRVMGLARWEMTSMGKKTGAK